MLDSPDELVTNVTEQGRTIRAQGVGWVEVALPHGSVTFAWPGVWLVPQLLEPHLRRSRSGYQPLVLLGDDRTFTERRAERLRDDGEISLETLPASAARVDVILANHTETLRLRKIAAEGELVTERYQFEIDELNAIGRALSSVRSIDRLLGMILEKSRYVTDADAGSVYVVEGEDEDLSKRTLRFKISQNDSRKMDFTEFTLPVSPSSIVGRCVLARATINIDDLYTLDENNPFGLVHNRAFDEKSGYQTRSMLAVPMIDAQKQVIGVIQLINRKRRPETILEAASDFDRFVIPFDDRTSSLAATLASQAAISLENTMLYEDISQLFEGFVTASVTAIEQRDPTTSGHSQRVANLTCELAKMTEKAERGAYRSYRTSASELKQMEYAALLHDFGKVGVREHILVKARKLFDSDRDLIVARFDLIRRDLEAEAERKKVRVLLEAPRDEALAVIAALDVELAARTAELDDHVALVLRANEPTVLDQGGFDRLGVIAGHSYRDPRGEIQPYLTAREVETLQILRGSLTSRERVEIESHVVHTYNFLRRIPWGRTFKNVPEWAGAHHEKLDGTGYPRRLVGDDIPVPARMMTISDIYDALTASDRPYKRAVPTDKALDIIGSEVKHGKCDPELFRIFIEAKVWQVAHRS